MGPIPRSAAFRLSALRPLGSLGIGTLAVLAVVPLVVTTPLEAADPVEPGIESPFHPRAPQISTPQHGSVVWGGTVAQVEWLEDPLDPPAEVVLMNGDRPLPTRPQDWVAGDGQRRLVADLPRQPGTLQLRPLARWKDGRVIGGQPVTVTVLPAVAGGLSVSSALPPGGVLNGSATDTVDGVPCLAAFGGGDLFTIPVEVPTDSLWQVMANVRGQPTQGNWPVVEVMVDHHDPSETGGVAAFPTWTRVPLGRPLRLAAGSHQLTIRFSNDSYQAPGHDRNLWIGQVEVRQVQNWTEPCDDQTGTRFQPLRVAWKWVPPPSASAALGLGVRLWWDGQDGAAPIPTTRLLVDGQVLSTQVSRVPWFRLPAAAVSPGRHRLEVEAREPDGTTSRSTPVLVDWKPLPGLGTTSGFSTASTGSGATAGAVQGTRWLRIAANDPQWQAVVRQNVKNSMEHDVVLSGTLAMPWSGRTRIHLNGRSVDTANGSVTVAMLVDGTLHDQGKIDVHDWGGGGDLPIVDLPPGAWLRFGNEHGAIEHVELEQVPEDVRAPTATVRWPTPGTNVAGGLVLVGDVADDQAIGSVEALIDGVPSGMPMTPAEGTRQVVPVVLRQLPLGEHTVALRVRDGNWTLGDSQPVMIKVIPQEDPSADQLPLAKAVRLLDRLGYGADALSLGGMLVDGPERWLDQQFAPGPGAQRAEAALAATACTFPDPASGWDVENRVVLDAMLTPRPAAARLQWFVRNHFSTWIGKIEGFDTWQVVLALRAAGVSFPEALTASSRSPAMLRYLDQVDSRAGAINENYARELLELHTLGVHGGYTQADVTTLAHILAGWTASGMGGDYGKGVRPRRSFGFDPTLAEETGGVFLGQTIGNAAVADRYTRAALVVDHLIDQPATATFVGGKLADHLGLKDDKARKAVIDAFARSHGDLGRCLVAALPYLNNVEPRLAHASDVAIRLGRTLNMEHPWAAMELLNSSGNSPFGRLTPDGYPDDDSRHVDSNAMLQRLRMAERISNAVADVLPMGQRWNGQPLTAVDARRYADWLTLRLGGSVLSPETLAAVESAAMTGEGDRNARLLRLAQAIVMAPPFQLR